MSLDEQNTISPWQSETVRAAVKVIIINVATLIASFTGKQLDIDSIRAFTDFWLPLAANVGSAVWGYKAYKGRINATQQIETKKEPGA